MCLEAYRKEHDSSSERTVVGQKGHIITSKYTTSESVDCPCFEFLETYFGGRRYFVEIETMRIIQFLIDNIGELLSVHVQVSTFGINSCLRAYHLAPIVLLWPTICLSFLGVEDKL